MTIEPGGKDLSTKGGSRDRSDAIAREVFEREPPLNVPYEFLNIGGRKMSTSKGLGAAAHSFVEIVPPEPVRLLFLRPRPNQAIEFDPQGTDAIPRLFDEFDRLAAATAGREVRGELPAGHESIFRYSLLSPSADVEAEAAAFRPAFSHLALLLQIPNVDVRERVTAEKGSALTTREADILEGRIRAARAWLDTYAPESARLEVQREQLPPAARAPRPRTTPRGRHAGPGGGRRRPASGDDWQSLIFRLTKERDLSARRAFEAIYRVFLGRENGPRAGWLLASLDPDFVRARAWEASGWTAAWPGADPMPVGG